MPTVQKYGDKRQVATSALPGARLTAAETAISQGAGVAEANEQKALVGARIGAGIQQIGQRIYGSQQAEIRAERERETREAKARAIRTNVIQAENATFKAENDIYDHPEHGVLNRQGEASFSAPEEASAAFEQATGAIAETLGTDEAKLMYEEIRVRHRAANELRVHRHVANERQKFTAGVLKARVDNGVEETIKYNTTKNADGHFDLAAGAKQLNDTVAIFRDTAPQLGLSKEEIEEQVEAMQTRAHENTVNIYAANGNMKAARAYYDEMKTAGQIDPERWKTIEDTLHAGGVKKEAQIETEKIMKLGGTNEEQLEAARKIDDADVQDEVVGRLKVRHQEIKTKTREDHEELMTTLANKVRATGSAQFTPEEMRKLTAPEHEMFRQYAVSLATGIPVKTNAATFQSLYDMADKDPAAFAEVDLNKYLNHLSPSDLQEFTRLRSSIRAGNKKDIDAAMAGHLTQKQVVDEILRRSKIDPNPKEGTAEFSAVAQLQLSVNEQISAWKINNPGKTMSPQEVQGIADSMLKDVVTKPGTGSWWSTFKIGESRTDQYQKVGLLTIGDMTPTDKALAAEYLQSKKIPVTDANLLTAFKSVKALEATAPK